MVRLNPSSFRVLNQDGALDTMHSVEGADHVGAFLREARETTGRSVADVAQSLRIRRVYLEAIEDGRFDKLPGAAYAVGFVRSYATYLRLDEVKLVERFKEEASGIESHQELDFPTPLPEGRFPGGIVVALCLIIGAGVFAGWYWFQNQNTIEVARIPPPPAAPEQASAPADGDVPAPEIERTPLASPAAPAVTPEAAPPVEAAVVADGVNESGETVAEVTEPAVPLVPPSYLEPQIDPLASMADLPSIGNETAADASAPTEAGATATPGPRVDLSSSDNGQIYGAVNSDARIVVNALENTWVQVRDADENVVLTQMLRAGDKYLVPNRSGLWLMTGNAGGLDISVDGEPVPAIGARGESRRNVRLDTDLLRTGGAVVQ
ncbi:MAG: helix-turn-helix domain-containing protein [Alphaproteobacteria bacterium]|nr:helix-turn-helix domain-containing protein [Alphaproteobacteria bacterium]